VEFVGIGIAVVALVVAYLSWQEARKANTIATSALSLSETERQERDRERRARARFVIDLVLVGYQPGAEDVLRIAGTGGQLRLRITIRNVGDRASGRGKVDVTFPAIVNNSYARWSDPGGLPLPAHPEQASRIGGSVVLTRPIDSIGRDVDETMHVTFPFDVPPQGENDYSMTVTVAAEHADPASERFGLKIAPRR
jgi:hypothetical protein